MPEPTLTTAPTIHALKTWPRFFELVISGRKTFEVRRDDRDFKPGDTLLLQEWEDMQQSYTGREVRACVLDVFSLRPLYDAVGISISLESDPVAETTGKWGVSWDFPAGPDEGTFDTRAEAVAFIADMPEEGCDTMHVLYGESWFPSPCIDRIIEDIEEDFYNETCLEEPDPYLEEHLATSREALHADLEQAIRAVFRRHLKPIELWSEDCELSGDEAREEIGEGDDA